MALKPLKVTLYLISIYWTIWLIFKIYQTPCFNLFDSYVTLITILSSMVINDLMK